MVEMETTGSVVLAPTSGSYTARITAPYVMETAKRMGASVVALFIKGPGGSKLDGQKALRIYNEVAKAYGVEIKLQFKEGDVLENIMDAVETEEAAIVVMGSTEESFFGRIAKRPISQELLLHMSIPTMVVPIQALEKRRTKLPDPGKEDFQDESVDLSSLKNLENLDESIMEE